MNVFYCIMGSIFVSTTLIVGMILKIFPQKNINSFYGLKTKVTSKNQYTWDYAHKVCANTFLYYSIFTIIIFVSISIINPKFIKDYPYLIMILGFVLAMIGVIITRLIVQSKTKKHEKYND